MLKGDVTLETAAGDAYTPVSHAPHDRLALRHLPSRHPTPTGVVLKGDVTLETAAEGTPTPLYRMHPMTLWP